MKTTFFILFCIIAFFSSAQTRTQDKIAGKELKTSVGVFTLFTPSEELQKEDDYTTGSITTADGGTATFIINKEEEEKENFTISEQSEVKIYPNPFTSSATVTNEFTNGELKIYNLLGEEVKNYRLSTANYQLMRGDLPGGIFFYTVDDGKNTSRGKIMIY